MLGLFKGSSMGSLLSLSSPDLPKWWKMAMITTKARKAEKAINISLCLLLDLWPRPRRLGATYDLHHLVNQVSADRRLYLFSSMSSLRSSAADDDVISSGEVIEDILEAIATSLLRLDRFANGLEEKSDI